METVVWVHDGGFAVRTTTDLPSNFGTKATGLLTLPSAWTLDFLAVSPGLFEEYSFTPSPERLHVVERWLLAIEDGLQASGIAPTALLIIRSNAVGEGLRERGSYRSQRSSRTDLLHNLQLLLSELRDLSPDARLGLIVQEYREPVMNGHLSNERRVAKEFRDGLVEFTDPQTGAMDEAKIGHRNWRRSPDNVVHQPLACSAREQIKRVLRRPLARAAQQRRRVHYEWVWDGTVVYIVQADDAQDDPGGESPMATPLTVALPSRKYQLRRFSIAEDGPTPSLPKLQSHMRYIAHGFWQPTFYVLDDHDTMASLCDGEVPADVEDDLKDLLHAPLMIRTACRDHAVFLLPRSPVLTNLDRATSWLATTLPQKLEEVERQPDGLALLAHHFIPAHGAAFSYGAPDKADVLIESLWGVPEGLYYFPCDKYMVSTPPSFSPSTDD